MMEDADDTGPGDPSFDSEETPRSPTGLIDRDTAPGLARLAANAWLQTGIWSAETSLRIAKRLGRAAVSPDSAMSLADDAQREIAAVGRKVLRIRDEDPDKAETQRDTSNYDDEALRNRWQDLLELSNDIDVDEVDGHPAFADILTQLHPDEARILRLFAAEGAQVAVDVRNWRPLGIGSHVVAPGLNMIGQHAGCLMVDRVPVYLSNLFRLGLIWFSREAIPDIGSYQVLEAQPEVTEALKEAGRGTTVRRSVRLTPFGEQFCAACLPKNTAEFEAISTAAARPVDEVPPPTEEPEPGVT
jgi:Abortive infection alpha